jgi:hypothetical protein
VARGRLEEPAETMAGAAEPVQGAVERVRSVRRRVSGE